MIIQRLTEEELALVEILEHPVWNAEFLRNLVDERWVHTDYQKLILADCNPHVSFRAGRAVGKSETLIDKLVYYALNDFFPTPTLSIATPNRVHLEPLWRKLTRWLTSHPLLKHFRESVNSQSFRIGLANGVTIDCRIAGIGDTGSSVIGLHTPVLVVDEAGFFPWNTWIELMPTVNTWERGSQVFVCGTPSGQRDKNVLYFSDMISEQFSKHRVSARDNPRYTEADEQRNIEQYGGADNDDFQRLVLGEHSSPVELLFSKDTMSTLDFNMFTANIAGKDLEEDPLRIERMFAALPKRTGQIAAGIDLGYTDPTIISLFEYTNDAWIHFARISLQHIEYPRQVKLIDRLDSLYNFTFLAIDEGHAGIAVAQVFNSEEYKHKEYPTRLIPTNFASSSSVGIDLDGEDVRINIKQLAVEKLKWLFATKKLLIATRDDRLISELERVESSRTINGKLIFRVRSYGGLTSSEDHQFASMLCFAYGIYLREDVVKEQRAQRLFTARWANK